MEQRKRSRTSSGFVRAQPPILGVDSVRAKVIKAYRKQAGLIPPAASETTTEINSDREDALDLEALLASDRKAA